MLISMRPSVYLVSYLITDDREELDSLIELSLIDKL